MSDEIDITGEFEWDDMIDRVVDLIPAKMTPRECRELRENVHNSLWASIGDLFDKATIEIRRSRGTESEIRLWMTVGPDRSEEHTSGLQSLMRISYAVFCLKKKTTRRVE